VERDPAGVPTHDLADQNPVMRLRGGVESINSFRRNRHRGVEAEGEVRCAEIVINGLGDTYRGKPGVGQSRCHPEGVFTTDGNKGIHAKRPHVVLDGVDTAVDFDGVSARRTQDGAAARENPAHLRDAEFHGEPLQRALPAIAEANKLVPVVRHSSTNNGADYRVQTRAIAASGQNPNAHVPIPWLFVNAVIPNLVDERRTLSSTPSSTRSSTRPSAGGYASSVEMCTRTNAQL
jgi:hypothetical protein